MTGLRVPDCIATLQSHPRRPSIWQRTSTWPRPICSGMVGCSSAATVLVHPVSHRRRQQPPAPSRGVSGFLQHVLPGPCARQHHAEAKCAYALQLCQLCFYTESLPLPWQEYPGSVSLLALAQPGAAANSRPDNGKGSHLFAVNIWVWLYWTEQQRKVSVLKAMEARVKRRRG